MSKTSGSRAEEIVSAAIELFNRRGVANVRSRDISDHLGISNGNLTYHFPTMAGLVEAAVSRLLSQGQSTTPPESTAPLTLSGYFSIVSHIVAIQRNFSFFYKDVLELTRRYPKVGQSYRGMLRQRLYQGKQLLAAFIEQGTLKPEPLAGAYDSLQVQMLTTMIFWETMEELVGTAGAVSFDPPRLVLDHLLPHLTERGRREYDALIAATPPTSIDPGEHNAKTES